MFLPRARLNVKEEKKYKKQNKTKQTDKKNHPNTQKMGRGNVEADVVELRDFSRVSQAGSCLVTGLARHESILQGNALPQTAVGLKGTKT